MSYYNDSSANELEVDFDKNVTRLYESISESEWDEAISDVQNNPKEAKTWVVRHHEDGEIMWRFLPIHSACARQPPEIVINALLAANRHGASSRDDQGMLPLHYACGNQASVDVIRLLLLAYPEAASTADPNGMMPLHYIAQWGPSEIEAVDVLLFANRNALKAQDVDGNTPIDLARDGDYDDGQKEFVISALRRFMIPASSSDTSNTSTITSRDYTTQHMQQHSDLSNIDKSPRTRSKATNRQSNSFQPVQKITLEQVTTMPKTSEAVKRLQEAAAAQQNAREQYLRSSGISAESRDDGLEGVSHTGSTLTTKLSRSRASSDHTEKIAFHNNMNSGMRSLSINSDIGSVDTQTLRMVESLQEQVDKLRAEAAMEETTAQKQIATERFEMQKVIDQMKMKLAECEKETMGSVSDLTAKEELCLLVDNRLKDKESELAAVMKKNEQLRSAIEKTKHNIVKYRKKTSTLDEHLNALAKSMSSMMEEQDQIMKASIEHEEHMKKISLTRQQKMQELIDQEVEFARESLEKQRQSDLGSEEMINVALDAQKKLMASIADVLAPKHGIEEEGSIHGESMIMV